MDWADYLRDQAAKYRQLAETAEDLRIKQELLDLAAICEEVANNIEDRLPGGKWRVRFRLPVGRHSRMSRSSSRRRPRMAIISSLLS
jgi:hypothetical protein